MPFDWGNVGSALLGTFVGSFLSTTTAYVLQRRQFRHAKKDREDDRFERRKGHALALLFKTIQITSSFDGIDKHLKEGFAKLKGQKDNLMSWQVVIPFANLPARVEFTPELPTGATDPPRMKQRRDPMRENIFLYIWPNGASFSSVSY